MLINILFWQNHVGMRNLLLHNVDKSCCQKLYVLMLSRNCMLQKENNWSIHNLAHAMTAQFWYDWINRIKCSAKQNFQLWYHRSFVKWSQSLCQETVLFRINKSVSFLLITPANKPLNCSTKPLDYGSIFHGIHLSEAARVPNHGKNI